MHKRQPIQLTIQIQKWYNTKYYYDTPFFMPWSVNPAIDFPWNWLVLHREARLKISGQKF